MLKVKKQLSKRLTNSFTTNKKLTRGSEELACDDLWCLLELLDECLLPCF